MYKKLLKLKISLYNNSKLEKAFDMKFIWMVALLVTLSNCGTFGGAVRGLGSDLDIVGSYITDF